MRAARLPLVALLVAPALAAAEPSFVLAHHGRLLDAQDRPAEGLVALTFELHTAPASIVGDAVVWTDTFEGVRVGRDGTYAVLLGDDAPTTQSGHVKLTPGLFAGNRWLAVKVAGSILAPWLRIGSVAFAADAGAVSGFPASATPAPGALLALDEAGRFPSSVLAPASASADGVLRKEDFAAFTAKLSGLHVGAGLSGDGSSGSPLAVTQIGVTAQAPITGTGTTTSPLSVTFAGSGSAASVARADHAHDAAYVKQDGSTPFTGVLSGPLRVGGSVGIGTASPRTSLDVNGTITGRPAVANTGSIVDFGTGNLQYTDAACGAFILWNLKDGGSYTFVVKGTASTTCAFAAYGDGGTASLSLRMPPDHGPTLAGQQTLYSLVVLGSDVYVSWVPGY